ncbi:MAG: hypothetical protein PHI97_07185 [Desulfobulbus sp.]|nr:hypothetical protein [Desulfobulbus sp.]
MSTADIWGMLGELDEDQPLQVLTQLFARYEQRLEQNPENPEAALFFRDLAIILEQVQSCNLNRR